MDSLSRAWGQFKEGSKSTAGWLTEKFKGLKTTEEASKYRWWLLGLAAGVLALILLIWGARALMQNIGSETTAAPKPTPAAPPPQAATPEMGGPPRSEATTSAAKPQRVSLPVPKAQPPAPSQAVKTSKPATPPKSRYQLLVVTYLSYDEAREMKQRIRSKGLPAMVYRVTVKKKPYFVVKAGPFPDKERAAEVARRLKKEEHLGQMPKIVELRAAALKTSPAQARQ